MEILTWVASQKEKSPCKTENCTWYFEPGTHTAYSSTNYVLCGYLLLTFMPEGQNDSWEQLDLNYFIGLDPDVYLNTHFPTKGKVNEVGLTTPAITLEFGEAEIWEQD